jgi:hypothetical protein
MKIILTDVKHLNSRSGTTTSISSRKLRCLMARIKLQPTEFEKSADAA